MNDFVNSKTGDALPTDESQLTFRASPSKVGKDLIDVSVCYDPGGPKEPHAGRYQGSLLIGARGAQPTPLALTVSVADDRLFLPVFALLIGIIAGVLARFYGDKKANAVGTNADYVFAFCVGVAGSIAVYLKLVDANTTFNAAFSALWPLTVGAFTATIAGKTIKDLLPG